MFTGDPILIRCHEVISCWYPKFIRRCMVVFVIHYNHNLAHGSLCIVSSRIFKDGSGRIVS